MKKNSKKQTLLMAVADRKVNRYNKKDIKALVSLMESADTQEAFKIMATNCSPSTFIAVVRDYKYKIPSHFFSLLKGEANELLYEVPFNRVPMYSSAPLKIIINWRLIIGK